MRNKKTSLKTDAMTTSDTPSEIVHGNHHSAYSVLPWEDPDEYQSLCNELIETHEPHGATEQFLVEELTALMWRKRRLHLAEAASSRDGLNQVTTRVYDSVAKVASAARVRPAHR